MSARPVESGLLVALSALVALMLFLAGCGQTPSPSPSPTPTPTETPTPTPSPDNGEPVLSEAIIGNCTADSFASDKTGLAVGTQAINFTLKQVDGTEVRLSKLLAERPVVLIFSSYT